MRLAPAMAGAFSLLFVLFSSDAEDVSLLLSKDTGQNGQGWSADEVTGDDDTISRPVHRLHPRASAQSQNRQGARRRRGLGSCGAPFFIGSTPAERSA